MISNCSDCWFVMQLINRVPLLRFDRRRASVIMNHRAKERRYRERIRNQGKH